MRVSLMMSYSSIYSPGGIYQAILDTQHPKYITKSSLGCEGPPAQLSLMIIFMVDRCDWCDSMVRTRDSKHKDHMFQIR